MLKLSTCLMIASVVCGVSGRPMVRQIKSAREFDRLIEKHATSTGLPVIADFYSDGCGPCRQIAPVYQQLAKETGQENAVFVKINTQMVPELSGRYNIRSIPTFIFFLDGKKVDLINGASGQALQQSTNAVVNKSKRENVLLKKETLIEFYKEVDESTTEEKIDTVYQKCADMNKKYNPNKECIGSAALNLSKGLKKKYNKRVDTSVRFTEEDRKPSGAGKSTDTNKEDSASSKRKSGTAAPDKPNLHLASKEELMKELEKRLEAEEDAREEEMEDEEDFAEFEHSYKPSDFPERVTIIGGGPAGMSAAIYAARAGLRPVVVAPPGGGQLVGKGVEVENYPGLANVTGPEVVAAMRAQAAQFGAVFECESVISVDTSQRPFKVHTNSSVITTHAIVVATGAESNWLNVPGEYEMRGGGVSSCAVCDGAAFYGKDVIVVGGGDSAMEEALFLARTSKSVTVIHRREEFRASKILAQRVIDHPSIKIKWNTILKEIVGEKVISGATDTDGDDDSVDLDDEQLFVSGAHVKDVVTGEESKLSCEGVFVAIGHTPSTKFMEGVVEFDYKHSGYIMTQGVSTRTSVAGIFAAGDVSDAIYRQAVTSAGSGAAAALDAERWLSEEGLGNEEAEFEAALMAELMADDIGSPKTDHYNAYEDVGGKISGMKESASAEL